MIVIKEVPLKFLDPRVKPYLLNLYSDAHIKCLFQLDSEDNLDTMKRKLMKGVNIAQQLNQKWPQMKDTFLIAVAYKMGIEHSVILKALWDIFVESKSDVNDSIQKIILGKGTYVAN